MSAFQLRDLLVTGIRQAVASAKLVNDLAEAADGLHVEPLAVTVTAETRAEHVAGTAFLWYTDTTKDLAAVTIKIEGIIYPSTVTITEEERVVLSALGPGDVDAVKHWLTLALGSAVKAFEDSGDGPGWRWNLQQGLRKLRWPEDAEYPRKATREVYDFLEARAAKLEKK